MTRLFIYSCARIGLIGLPVCFGVSLRGLSLALQVLSGNCSIGTSEKWAIIVYLSICLSVYSRVNPLHVVYCIAHIVFD